MKFLNNHQFFLFLVSVVVFSCKEDEITPNRSPVSFEVTTTVGTDGKTITLRWSKAKDPDNDAVTYAVVLGDTLAKGLTDTTYTITTLDYDVIKDGKVIAKDPKGLSSEATFKATTTPRPNRPPASFAVTTTVGTDGKTITLRWNKANDPDNDAVTYAVVLGDTLSKGLTDTTYTITTLDYDVIKDGKVIAKDPEGLSSEATFKATTATNPFFAIPDANFEKYLVDDKIDKDGTINGKMAIEDAKGVTEISCKRSRIKSLVGIEHFVDLTSLLCNSNELTDLDLSKNVELEILNCSLNKLLNLNVNQHIKLKNLYCWHNQLSNLELSNNIDLLYLDCSENQITALDVTKNLKLERLNMAVNKISVLDISQNEALNRLICNENLLTSLGINRNENLLHLNCSSNQLKILDVSRNLQLKHLSCSKNQFQALDVSRNIQLDVLFCSQNQLITLDISKNSVLKYLYCNCNQLGNLDISKNKKLSYFGCCSNPLSVICVANVVKAKISKDWSKDAKAEYKVCN